MEKWNFDYVTKTYLFINIYVEVGVTELVLKENQTMTMEGFFLHQKT